jgi:CRP-like cAMP-binding protein
MIIQSSLSPLPQKTPSTRDRQVFGRRSPIPCGQNALWKIESGVVRSFTWLEDGTSVTLGLWRAENVVGRALSSIDPYQLECLTPVEAILLSNLHLSQLTDQIIDHIYQLEELTVIRSHRKVEDMLLKLLTWLAKRFGHPVEQGNVIDLRLTHQDLAELLASTRVTVTRLLNQFEQQGLIQRLPRQLIVLQADELWHYEI